MEHWEYHVVRDTYRGGTRHDDALTTLNNLGERGWELVAASEKEHEIPTGGPPDFAIVVGYYLRRQMA